MLKPAFSIRNLFIAIEGLAPSWAFSLLGRIAVLHFLGGEAWLNRYFGGHSSCVVELLKTSSCGTEGDKDLLKCFSGHRNRRSLANQLELAFAWW